MVQYFANYNNASVGQVKNLYIDWIRSNPREGAASKECQQLNALFSSCIDGERIKIPESLQMPPKPQSDVPQFILDVLCDRVKKKAENIFKSEPEAVAFTSEGVMEYLISTEDMCLKAIRNEFEVFKMILHYCQKNRTPVEDFFPYLDFRSFTNEQKHAILSYVEDPYIRDEYFACIFNGLTQSEIIPRVALKTFNLDDRRIRWQLMYSTFMDDGFRLETILEKFMTNFDKKLIVYNVDESLKVAIYISKRMEKFTEIDVWEAVRVYGFDPTSGLSYSNHAAKESKIFFDGEIMQLYTKRRPNTFIWLALNAAFAQRNGIDDKKVPFKTSIALQKFDNHLMKSHGRIIKQPCHGMELYVISNRDRVGHDILFNLMSDKETTEIKRNIQNTPQEYNLLVEEADWTNREFCEDIIRKKNIPEVLRLTQGCEFQMLFDLCLYLREYSTLFDAVKFTLDEFNNLRIQELPEMVVKLVEKVPAIANLIVQTLYDSKMQKQGEQQQQPNSFTIPSRPENYLKLAKALIISTTEHRELSIRKFEQLLELLCENELQFSLYQMKELVKFICFTVRDFQLGLKYLDIIFDEESLPIFRTTATATSSKNSAAELLDFNYYLHFIRALATDYLNEVHEACPCDMWGLPKGSDDDQQLLLLGEAKTFNNKSRPDTPVKFSDFFPSTQEDAPVVTTAGRNDKDIPEAHQRCLEIISPQTPDPDDDEPEIVVDANLVIYSTVLRVDIPCTIRNEDHIRFCASRRSSDKSKQRITVFDAVVVSLSRGTLKFSILQPPPAELSTASWNLYICASTTNLTTQVDAIEKLITGKEKATSAYMDIVGFPLNPQRPLLKNTVEVSFKGSTFNPSQEKAVKTAVNNPLTLIWGPPGTGKTTVVVQIILNFLRFYSGARLLVSASTHNAVDNVMERFLKEYAKQSQDAGNDEDNFIRVTSDVSKVSPSLKKWTLDAFVGGDIHSNYKTKDQASKKLRKASVVFSTCSGAGVGLLRSSGEDNDKKNNEDNGKKSKKKKKADPLLFDIVIVDEASQITEPNALIPIVKASRFVVLVGDHVQLQPTVTETAKEHNLQVSLFQKLYESSSVTAEKVMLNVQYRMHPDIAKYASDQFYGSKLLDGVKKSDRPLPPSVFHWPCQSQDQGQEPKTEGEEDRFRFVFVTCSNPETFGASKSNIGQANLAAKIIKLLQTTSGDGNFVKPSITVLTPYTKQVKLLNERLKGVGGVEVGTIDGFQGREADIIIFSTVRANSHQQLGFLDDSRRVNVAVTRAKYGLIVIGDGSTLEENNLWKSLMNYSARLDGKSLFTFK